MRTLIDRTVGRICRSAPTQAPPCIQGSCRELLPNSDVRAKREVLREVIEVDSATILLSTVTSLAAGVKVAGDASSSALTPAI